MRKLGLLTATAIFATAVGFAGTAWGEVLYSFDGDLIGYWHYDTNSGTNDAVDDSSNSNDGDLVGTATRDGGILPPIANTTNSLLLDGSGAMEIPGSVTTPLDMSPDYTVAAWFNTSSSAQIDIYGGSNQVGSAHNNLLEINSGVLRFLHREPAANSGGIDLFSGGGFADGAWHHVAGVKDGTNLILYVDGSSVASTTGAPDFTTDIAVVVGQQTNLVDTRRFIGNIDDVRIYDTALSAEEIGVLFNGPPTGLTKELTSGPDLDAVGGIDIAIQINQTTTTTPAYDFELTYVPAESDPDNVVIIDTVPAEWDVSFIDDGMVPDSNDAPHKGPNQGTGLGLGCGESESGLGIGGKVALERGGKVDKKCSSSTTISWDLTPSDPTQTVKVDVTTRQSPSGKLRFKPTSCGKLTINDGAQAFEANPDGTLVLDPPVTGVPIPVGDPSNSLMLVAVDDLNGGGLVGDGSGDEDGDGLTDADEAFNVGTDPCVADTDGDGFSDGVEVGAGTDPLDPGDFPT